MLTVGQVLLGTVLLFVLVFGNVNERFNKNDIDKIKLITRIRLTKYGWAYAGNKGVEAKEQKIKG